MAMFEDMFKGSGVPGLAIGIGAAVLAPVVLPAIGRAMRPVAKAIIKTGISAYRETSSQLSSATSSIVEEARGELAASE
jgi:hypothetical protein